MSTIGPDRQRGQRERVLAAALMAVSGAYVLVGLGLLPAGANQAVLLGGTVVLLAAVATQCRALRALRVEHALAVHAATHDPLTGLANRRLFVDTLEAVTTSAQRCAVVLADLDGFKAVNDTFGHLVGDDFLVEVGARLRRLAQPGDVAARLSGDEFAILRPDCGQAGAVDLVARVSAALDGWVVLDGERIPLRASVGLAVPARARGPETARELLRRADEAMYEAKRSAAIARLATTAPVPATPAPATLAPERLVPA